MIRKLWIALLLIILGLVLAIATTALYDWYQEHQYIKLTQKAIIKPTKVFQIGFSKCGTVTITDFFNDNGIPAIHHDFGHLATSIFANAQKGQPLIAPQYAKYVVFTDMERMYDVPLLSVGVSLFKELDRQYPGSKFILNTRDKQAWLNSRATHPINRKHAKTLIELNSKLLNISSEEVLNNWSNEWDTHHMAVLEYFKDRPQDLLVFNIDTDEPQKIAEFFKEYFVLDPKKYRHKNKSSDRVKQKNEAVEQIEFFSKTYPLHTTR